MHSGKCIHWMEAENFDIRYFGQCFLYVHETSQVLSTKKKKSFSEEKFLKRPIVSIVSGTIEKI